MARSSSKDDLASTLVAATAGNVLQLWEATPGEPLGGSRVVAHPASVACAAWNRNNKVVAVGCADGTIRLAYSNGNVMSALPRDAGTAAGMGAITSLSWAVGSQRLAAGSSNGCTYVFNIKPQVRR